MKMKKIILLAAFLAATAGANAQTLGDAIAYSQNHYFGTARSLSMGNAMTAVGGDLGSVGINPAGSAVAGYGQFTITPGLSISSVNTAYSPEGENAFNLQSNLTQTRMQLPNIGLSMTYKTGNRYGLNSLSFAIISNQTNVYNFASDGFGSNSRTSKIAEFANAATGIPESTLATYSSFNNSDVPWDLLAAYQGGMYGPYGWDNVYAGVTEQIADDGSYCYVPAALAQTSSRTKRGSKNDLVLNMGANFSDRLYVGINIGLPTARYRYTEYFHEAAVDPSQFPIVYGDVDGDYTTYFVRGSYNYQYLADMAGIYAKIGVIVRPFDGLRIGASFQTPTSFTISERWQESASTTFDDKYYDDNVTSPEGAFEYTLRTPYRASFGLAYTMGKMGVLSFDYELADYSVMRFGQLRRDRLMDNSFAVQNAVNRYFAGVSHAFRVGAEIRVTPEFSLRAGYNLTTSPERWWTNSEGQKVEAGDYEGYFSVYNDRVISLVTPHYYNDRTRAFSFGFGYSSPRSFFLDAAVQLTKYPVSIFAPYYDYDSYDAAGNLQAVAAPRLRDERNLWYAALTFGWRF